MKKLIIFFCICSFICACQIVDMPYEKDVNYSNQSPKIDKTKTSITINDAYIVANLFKSKGIATKVADINNIGESFSITQSNGDTLMYVINFKNNQGFIIVSASKFYEPILAYSDFGRFEKNYIGSPIEVWVQEQENVSDVVMEDTVLRNLYRAKWNIYEDSAIKNNSDVKSESITQVRSDFVSYWESQGGICYPLYEQPKNLPDDIYSNFCLQAEGIANPEYDYMANSIIVEVNQVRNNLNTGVLISTKWDQTVSATSVDNEPVGCTSVAVGQIIKYHEHHPQFYYWGGMNMYGTDVYTRPFLETISQSINWSISPTTSDPLSARNYLVNCGYANANVRSHDKSIVKNNLLLSRPVLMSGASGASSGHSWVCAGYRTSSQSSEYHLYVLSIVPPLQYEYSGLNYTYSSGNGEYFYMNWGWGGLYDGWYFGDSVIAGQYNFSSFRSDIIDIYPTE